MSTLKGFMGGLMAGGLIGAGAMLLLAPKSGKRTRGKILHRYGEFRDQMAESMEDAEEEVLSKAHRLSSDARGMVKDFQHRGQNVFDQR